MPFVGLEQQTIARRTCDVLKVKILNNQVKTACIPSLNLGDGIYVGEAIVTNTNGRVNIKIFNTNETDVKITIPTVQLEIFERADEHNVPFLGYDGHVLETQQFYPSMTSLAHVHSKDYSGDLLHIDTSELSSLEQGKRATESILNHDSISQQRGDPNRSETANSTSFQIDCPYKTITKVSESRCEQALRYVKLDELNNEKEIAENIIRNSINVFHLLGNKLTHMKIIDHNIETINSILVNKTE
uniref:Uncharacterized protein n=1 Tax=Vespula pensylvanica TaxID=30213 RepID=A0A834N336_VESPE|nr:hypothetical protein H0235_017462 [Vespula pensylvanica]